MPVIVERAGKRIQLRSPYSPQNVALAKSVPGHSWSKKDGCWTYPLSMDHCRELRTAFGDELKIGPELSAWARVQVGREQALSSLLNASISLEALGDRTPNMRKLVPALYEAMLTRPYQLAAVAYTAEARGALIGDQPGLGKTLECLGAIVEGLPGGGRVLVTAPKTAMRLVWEREIKQWLGDQAGVHVIQGGPTKREGLVAEMLDDKHRWVFAVANLEQLRTKRHEECQECDGSKELHSKSHKTISWYEHMGTPALFKVEWAAVVADESHKGIARSKGSNTQTREGFVRLNIADGGMKIALSGTPFRGKTANAWGTLNWLRPEHYTSFWSWAETYLEVSNNPWGGKDVGEIKHEKEASFWRSLDAVMIRRTKQELHKLNQAWAPAPKEYQTVWAEMAPEQEKAYREIEADAVALIKGGELSANGILAELTRMKQFACSAGRVEEIEEWDKELEETVIKTRFIPQLPSGKFDRLVQMLEERGIAGPEDERGGDQKIVVVSQFTQLINCFSEALKDMNIKHHVLTGETKDNERVRIVRDFQESTGPEATRVFLLNTTAGGVAVTLDAAREMIILDEMWTPDDMEQVEDRIHRTTSHATSDDPITIYYMSTIGTIDERIAEVVADKDIRQKTHLDARRGVEIVRRLIG